MGFYPSGDLGTLTIYTSKRHDLVYFEKTWPDKPPSALQRVIRTRMRAAAWLWTQLPEPERLDWLRAARLAGLRITGYNLFISYLFTQDEEMIRTIERQTGIALL